jgi:hypothetical protein
MSGCRTVSLARMHTPTACLLIPASAPSAVRCRSARLGVGQNRRLGKLGHPRDRRELSNGCSVDGAESFSWSGMGSAVRRRMPGAFAPSPDTPVVVWSGIMMSAFFRRSTCLGHPGCRRLVVGERTSATVRVLADLTAPIRAVATRNRERDAERVTGEASDPQNP